MNELRGELHQLEVWERLPAGGGDNSASLQDELGQAHAGLPEAGLALREGEGRPLEAVADALAGELHHALFQGPQGEEGLLLVLVGGKPRELLLGADAPQQGGRECAGASASTPPADRLRAQHTSPRQWLRLYSTGHLGNRACPAAVRLWAREESSRPCSRFRHRPEAFLPRARWWASSSRRGGRFYGVSSGVQHGFPSPLCFRFQQAMWLLVFHLVL